MPLVGPRTAGTVTCMLTQVYEALLALLAPFEREQRLRKHRRWCAGICGNSLL
jgi:hypothetical protein